MRIEFTVIDKPEPAGSKKAFPFRRRDGSLGANVVDDNDKAKGWKRSVAVEARIAYDGPLLEGALKLQIALFFPRPKGHFGTKGLKDAAPSHHLVRPDATKCLRGIEDALQGVLYRNDSQIVLQIVSKQFGEPGRAEITVSVL